MKKTCTLLAIAALLSSASFAQNNYGYNRDHEVVVSNNRGGNGWGRGGYFFSAREKDMQISSINYKYSRKIESVRNKFFMSRSKKERIVCALEVQRDEEIRSVIEKFNDPRNHFDRRNDGYHDHWNDRRDDRDRRDNW